MNAEFPAYRKLDMETWPRREHFAYYRKILPCGYSLTSRLDVTELLRCAKDRDLRFVVCFLYAATRTVNETEEMRMMTDPEGNPGIWETVHPNFTVFHQDDKTFSDLWTEYRPEFADFYREWERVTAVYGDNHGVKGRPGQPANFFCISCVPWLDYTGYSTHTPGEPALFPIITFGKYSEAAGRLTLPATVTIAHAAADGYHTAQLFRRIQEELDGFAAME